MEAVFLLSVMMFIRVSRGFLLEAFPEILDLDIIDENFLLFIMRFSEIM
ncbi:hypothetical protein SAMN02910368_01373 [Lachnospiraceae bacterium G11]|nr:hypothetical protein SAMN02910368_01373 [Lachnospiraceae bacterium G11]